MRGSLAALRRQQLLGVGGAISTARAIGNGKAWKRFGAIINRKWEFIRENERGNHGAHDVGYSLAGNETLAGKVLGRCYSWFGQKIGQVFSVKPSSGIVVGDAASV